jgi:RES domain-containing protein
MLAPKWADDPLSGAGAALRGGRFNPPGMPALYMSEEFVTAVAEYEQDLGIRPGTLCAYDVKSERIVDLGDALTLETLGVDAAALRAPWKHIAFVEKRLPPTWPLAERLLQEGIDGARVPSAQAIGLNLVLWRWNVERAARVVALDPLRDLPADQSSWRR